MSTRLRALPFGWIAIAAAYMMAVLPITATNQMIWLAVGVIPAYLVLAIRTTRTIAALADSSRHQSVFALWWTAFRATLMNRALLVLPMFCLMMAAQKFLAYSNYECSSLLRAFCSMNSSGTQLELLVIASSVLGVFLLLDHGLLIALTLLTHKYLEKSPAVVGNTAVGLRFTLACVLVGLGSIALNLWDQAHSGYPFDSITVSERRVVQTIYPSFEPLVTNGILLNANLMSHVSYCSNPSQPCNPYDTRPFVARQMVSALMGMLMYGLMILVTLRLVSPFSLSVGVTEKAKRGPAHNESVLDITYL